MAKGNSKLNEAKVAKNDEFYTQYDDIQNEINAYIEYNPDVFRDKVVLLPCDDPEWSNFTKFFVNNFRAFGLKKLISTSYAVESKHYKEGYQPSLFETSAPQYDEDKTRTHGKIFVLEKDINDDGVIDVNDLQWDYLEGTGDFMSDEVKALRDQSDIIVTNEPFSLFLEFLGWIMEAGKKFLIIANKLSTGCRDVFPLIRDNKIWSGKRDWSGGMWFVTTNDEDVDKVIDGQKMKNVASIWLTNLEHGKRHEPISLMTMADNLRFSKHKEIREKGYRKYDNYDAIDVPYVDAIPSDYDGLMGVPVSFFNRYCPEQFEIVTQGEGQQYFTPTRYYEYFLDGRTGRPSNAKRDYQLYIQDEDGDYMTPYGYRVNKASKRIIIRKKL